jgi:hypothetical protein
MRDCPVILTTCAGIRVYSESASPSYHRFSSLSPPFPQDRGAVVSLDELAMASQRLEFAFQADLGVGGAFFIPASEDD